MTDSKSNLSIEARPSVAPASTDVTTTRTQEPQVQEPSQEAITEQDAAARLIQRCYRGYRTRRELKGFSLDPSTRWLEAVNEAQWHQSRKVQLPSGDEGQDADTHIEEDESHNGEEGSTYSPEVRKKWRRVGQVALRAGGDDNIGDKLAEQRIVSSETKVSESSSGITSATRRSTRRSTVDIEKTAKMMDLQYFLEMVDTKHRYGSHLRTYHNYWKNCPSKQNFFYWLDYGEGKGVELEQCPRDRLQREQVRYLTREERMDYLVIVDEAGRFRWVKNGERVWTDSERYRDSIKGVVPVEDKTPTFREYSKEGNELLEHFSSSSSSSTEGSSDEAKRYMNPEFEEAKGVKKLAYVSPAVIFNHLMRKSLKKRDKWIFVADTSYRLYIGIKESGAFQHSSFLRGARISAAGLIKIKDGQLRSLSPLSGHYRPPAANFRAFVHALQQQGVDMSRVSISRSYAVLVGIEGYMKTKRKVKRVHEKIDEEKAKLVNKDDDDGASRGRSTDKSALGKTAIIGENNHTADVNAVDRSVTANSTTTRASAPDQQISDGKSGPGFFSGIVKTIARRGSKLDQSEGSESVHIRGRGVPGTAPEEGVPPPEGKR